MESPLRRAAVLPALVVLLMACNPPEVSDETSVRTVHAMSVSEPAPPPRPDHCGDYDNMEAGRGHPENQAWFNGLDAQGYARLTIACKQAWGADQWACLDALWAAESGWDHLAHNSYSGAHGVPQSLPGSKMASEARPGEDWRSNPRVQVRWGISYVAGRYGTACAAWSHFQRSGWY